MNSWKALFCSFAVWALVYAVSRLISEQAGQVLTGAIAGVAIAWLFRFYGDRPSTPS